METEELAKKLTAEANSLEDEAALESVRSIMLDAASRLRELHALFQRSSRKTQTRTMSDLEMIQQIRAWFEHDGFEEWEQLLNRFIELSQAQQWRSIEEAEKDGTPQAKPTVWTIMPIREGMEHFAITIHRMNSPFYDGERFAVRRMSYVLSVDGQWAYEPMPSSRDDAFYKAFRFQSFDDAIEAAWHAARQYKVNGHAVYDLPPAPQGGGD